MPNRMLRESFITSDSVASLSWFEQALLTRLILSCDDFGRMDARTKILQTRLFPLAEDVAGEMIERGLDKLEALGTIRRYVVDGRLYLRMVNWFVHQKLKNHRAKYPPEPDETPALEQDLQQIRKSASKLELELEVEAELEAEVEVKVEAEPVPAPASEPETTTTTDTTTDAICAVCLPVGGGEARLTPDQARALARTYPALDIAHELTKAAGWMRLHPERNRSRATLLSFLNDWMARARASPGPPMPASAASDVMRGTAGARPAVAFPQRRYEAAFFDSFFCDPEQKEARAHDVVARAP